LYPKNETNFFFNLQVLMYLIMLGNNLVVNLRLEVSGNIFKDNKNIIIIIIATYMKINTHTCK